MAIVALGGTVVTTSAGILLYRRGAAGLEVLLGHMGGPFWAKKDDGGWSIPKGEHGPDEEPEAVARREFEEELGSPVPADELAVQPRLHRVREPELVELRIRIDHLGDQPRAALTGPRHRGATLEDLEEPAVTVDEHAGELCAGVVLAADGEQGGEVVVGERLCRRARVHE